MTEMPHVVAQYQDAHDRRDVERALAWFTPNAVVKDDGHEYHGRDRIRDWLSGASTQFSYTRTLTGADAVDGNTWLVTNHLEGNFPGGVVDLRYRFVLIDDLISKLEIPPDSSQRPASRFAGFSPDDARIGRAMRRPVGAVRRGGGGR
jgi:ketosteroid isomerase-like protein